jgi:hypothetical protein
MSSFSLPVVTGDLTCAMTGTEHRKSRVMGILLIMVEIIGCAIKIAIFYSPWNLITYLL